jgi:DNA-directed RNA polymerase II subunit RPB1
MSRTAKFDNTRNLSKIVGIQFSILSPEEILKGSVAEITSRDTYVNNKPVIGGLFDPRMGVLEPGLICPTDGLDYMMTPGYFGHIKLARPVFYIQYLSTILKVLNCVVNFFYRTTLQSRISATAQNRTTTAQVFVVFFCCNFLFLL